MEDLEHKERFGLSLTDLLSVPTVFRADLFAGHTVLVSGSGSGIGQAIAVLFARLGAGVMLCGRRPEPLQETAAAIAQAGGDVDFLPMTIREPDQVAQLMERVWERFGKLDVLINNAGGQFAAPGTEITPKGWNAVIDTNLNGAWYMTQAAARRWQDAGVPGQVINITLSNFRGMPSIAHSSAARAAVMNLARTLAVEWAPYRIRVNCVAPGAIESSGFDRYPRPMLKGFYNSNPMRTLGDVMDIAHACAYLAADSGKFINGETLVVDGRGQLWGEQWLAARPPHFDPT